MVSMIAAMENVSMVRQLSPVLPVLSRSEISVPFSSYREILDYNVDKKLALSDLAIHYESQRGGLERTEVIKKVIEKRFETGAAKSET